MAPCRRIGIEAKMQSMNTTLRKAALLALAVSFLGLFTVFSTSCGTARGFGRDLGHVGDGIQRVAR